MGTGSKAFLYVNAIRYLKPIQITYQIANRLRRKRKTNLRNQVRKKRPSTIRPVTIMIPELDFDEAYLQRFDVEALLQDEIMLLHETHKVKAGNWQVKEASHLWNYNLHYLEFLISLAFQYSQTKNEKYYLKWCEYVREWLNQDSKDSFEPYTISMRIPNLLICMELLQENLHGTELEEQLYLSIYQQYRYLLKSKELALLANHYFENLKAIIIGSILFGEQKEFEDHYTELIRQLEEQILSDGLHFERSAMYHKIMLEGLLRLVVLKQARSDKLESIIKKMATGVTSLEHGFDRTPLFNDAGDNVAKSAQSLAKATERILDITLERSQKNFPAAGYYKLIQKENVLLFDCGEIGPCYMGGHSHNDCLSFEFAVKGEPLLVNAGTGQYQSRLRPFFRSTKAHNTVMLDGEQSELWGEHRASRRLCNIDCTAKGNLIEGSFTSYQGDRFYRKLQLTEDRITIIDSVRAKRKDAGFVRQFFHIAPEYTLQEEKQGKEIIVKHRKTQKEVMSFQLPQDAQTQIYHEGELCSYAEEFGKLEQIDVLEVKTAYEEGKQIKVDILFSMKI